MRPSGHLAVREDRAALSEPGDRRRLPAAAGPAWFLRMQLYLVRHAHAFAADANPVRPLSPRGRAQVRALAAFLKPTRAFACAEVWHSPLARSRETAALLVQQLRLRAKLVQVDGLEGDDDPAPIAARLQRRRAPLALVGHEPHLSALASLLVAGAAQPPRFILKKCAALALNRDAGQWLVRWQVSPELTG